MRIGVMDLGYYYGKVTLVTKKYGTSPIVYC